MASGELDERTISSQLIYDGRVVHLYVDMVGLPDGSTTRREVVRHSGAVAIVALDQDGQAVLVRQYRYAAGRTLLEIPAGTLEVGEPPDVCASRELQEEAGYRPGRMQKLGGIFVAPGYTSEFIHLYLATELVPSRLDADDDEFLEVVHMPFADALACIQSGDIADAKSITGLLLARDYLSRAQSDAS
jgi:ADP-ribose pyrophosphatase